MSFLVYELRHNVLPAVHLTQCHLSCIENPQKCVLGTDEFCTGLEIEGEVWNFAGSASFVSDLLSLSWQLIFTKGIFLLPGLFAI